MIKSPFRNYKRALQYLMIKTNKLNILSDYQPTPTDWALYTLFKSKTFMKRMK